MFTQNSRCLHTSFFQGLYLKTQSKSCHRTSEIFSMEQSQNQDNLLTPGIGNGLENNSDHDQTAILI